MENNITPVFLTIRETAKTGILPEHALRKLSKDGCLPQIKSGNRVLINYPKLLSELSNLSSNF